MKHPPYKKLLRDMLTAVAPEGLTYAKILSNFKRQHPTQCRKVFIRQALTKAPFKLCRNKYVLGAKKKRRVTKKKTVATDTAGTSGAGATSGIARPVATPPLRIIGRPSAEPRAPVFDNSTVVAPLVPAVPGETIPQWQYYHDTWKTYDKSASDVVEAAYQEWHKNPYTDVRAIKSGEWQYMVDFNNMQQENIQHENHTKRAIRRVEE